MNATEAFQLAFQHQQSGQLPQAEAIYRQILEQVRAHAGASLNLGAILHASGRRADAVKIYRMALALDGSTAELWNNLGNVLLDLEDPEQSLAACRQALALNPHFASAHNNLGNALKAKGDPDAAAECYRRAIALDANFSLPLNNLGTILNTRGDMESAAACFQKAIELQPNYAEAISNLASTLGGLGHDAQAMELFTRAMALRPDYAEAHWNLGLFLLSRGDFERGWPEYEWRNKIHNLVQPRFQFSQPPWRGESLQGRKILLHGEQGCGDTIQFVRFSPLLAQQGAKISVYCQDELVRLLCTVPGISQVVGWSSAPPPSDFHAPLMSLPGIFRTNLGTIPAAVPYISADGAIQDRWRKMFEAGDAKKIGIAWAGGPLHGLDRLRSIALRQLAPLAATGKFHWVSLQKGDPASQVRDWPAEMLDCANDWRDFADTAGMVANLDLVISVDTSIAHLAGAMGKPVWTLIPRVPDFRWMRDRLDSPWYPTMRLFRQTKNADWSAPIAEMSHALRAL